jgi:hypothetical protein
VNGQSGVAVLPPELSGWKIVRDLDGTERWVPSLEYGAVDVREEDYTGPSSPFLITRTLSESALRLGTAAGRRQAFWALAGVGLVAWAVWAIWKRAR